MVKLSIYGLKYEIIDPALIDLFYKVSFQAVMTKISWFHPLKKNQDFLLYFVLFWGLIY